MLSNIASIATLILFVIYFTGRIITILAVKGIWKDQIVDYPGCPNTLNIVDEIGEPFDGSKVLISKEGIRNLKIYSLQYDQELNHVIKKEKIYSRSFLNIDEGIAIHIKMGELLPFYLVQYQTIDYRRVSIYWTDNQKSGVLSELVKPKHTFKSFFYYLFR